MIFLIGLMSGLAIAQQPVLGINSGVTYSAMHGVVTVDDAKERDTTLANSGLPGFLVGMYQTLPLNERWDVEGEVVYELLRFRSHTRLFDKGRINHFKIGLLFSYKPIDNWGIIGGVELVYRTNSASGSTLTGQLNGTEVAKGAYWQGVIGTRFTLDHDIRMEGRMNIPRMASVTRAFIGNPMDHELVVEQLQVFSLSIGWPLLR